MRLRLKNMFTPPETKASRTARLLAFESGGRARWTPRDYAALAREGYLTNPIVHRAVRLIAENVASCRYLVFEGAQEHEAHPLSMLLARPNPRQDGGAFLETLVSHLLLAGNAYVEAVALTGRCASFMRCGPIACRSCPVPTAGRRRMNIASAGAACASIRRIRGAADPASDILSSARRSLRPSAARAGCGRDRHAQCGGELEQGAARQCGAAVRRAGLCRAGRRGAVGRQFDRLKRELDDTYQGAVNAGRPLLLEGGLDWKAMSLTPKDMDFLEAKHAAAREIALAFGVPPMLLGIPGDNTYANYQEANRALLSQTVLPLASRIGNSFAQWLAPPFGESIRIVVDTDRIDALAADRAALWERVSNAAFLTLNEKREAVGYAPIEGGDRLE